MLILIRLQVIRLIVNKEIQIEIVDQEDMEDMVDMVDMDILEVEEDNTEI